MPLTVTTDVPFGNACNIQVTRENNLPYIHFAPDPHHGPEALWFCFKIINTEPREAAPRLRLVLDNLGNLLGGTAEGVLHPVYREADEWKRLDNATTKEHPDGRRYYEWYMPMPGSECDVALCYPYGPGAIESLLTEGGDFWNRDIIGTSQASRPLLRLSNSYGRAESDEPGIFLLARQHSGETPGSWVMHGFLEYIQNAAEHPPLTWVIPFADLDGIMNGDYGKDKFPYDLNRAWGKVPMRYETLVIERDIHRWINRCRPALGIDFHAPGACEKDGVYAFLPSPDFHGDIHHRAMDMANTISHELTPKYAAPNFARVATYPSRWETPNFTAYMAGLGVPALSVETPYSAILARVLTQVDYRIIGARMAKAVCSQLADA